MVVGSSPTRPTSDSSTYGNILAQYPAPLDTNVTKKALPEVKDEPTSEDEGLANGALGFGLGLGQEGLGRILDPVLLFLIKHRLGLDQQVEDGQRLLIEALTGGTAFFLGESLCAGHQILGERFEVTFGCKLAIGAPSRVCSIHD